MKNWIGIFILVTLGGLQWQCGETGEPAVNDQAAIAAPQSSAAKVKNPTAKTGSAVIKGKIANAENVRLFVEQHFFLTDVHHILGSTGIEADGTFQLDLSKPIEPGIYRLRIGRNKIYVPFAGGEKVIEITGDLANLSAETVQIKGVENFETDNKHLIAVMNGKVNEKNVGQHLSSTGHLPLKALLAAYAYGQNPNYLTAHQKILGELLAEDAQSKYAIDYGNLVRQLDLIANDPIQVGKVAPDIKLTGPDGKEYALSELRGKVVLLDFWASWCLPCRRENPNVVNVYDKYNKDGFEVFSVSLDKPNGKERWKDAIKQDNLKWPYHVSDLQGWSSAPARQYKVTGIPRTFLIDRDGKIAKINARGPALEPAVKELLQAG